MTEPSPTDPAAVTLELERLRRTIEVGFTRTDGSLALLVQRDDQFAAQLAELEGRIAAVERTRWPLPSLMALVALVGLAVALWPSSAR
ncbi:hypothetical protein [Streptomyces sp. NPDC051561]|uniref:hypothetical protein n=1 Tax=Streptomyces sp. NPDC051561 TaxID=3365658 RepID=UPI0037B8C7AE